MIVEIGECRIELHEGDICLEEVDAIVNAANSRLAGGSGVDGAIHRAAGAILMQQTRERYPGGCDVGKAVITDAGDLPAKYVFHTVGPVWQGGMEKESELLASAIRSCLNLAIENFCESISFPAISTGVFGYPKDQAAEVVIKEAANFLFEHQKPKLVRFVLFDNGTYGAFARVLEESSE